jgi:hypothetical protein
MFYNSGNYGVPLMTLAFPATGPLLQVFVVLCVHAADLQFFCVRVPLGRKNMGGAKGGQSGCRIL